MTLRLLDMLAEDLKHIADKDERDATRKRWRRVAEARLDGREPDCIDSADGVETVVYMPALAHRATAEFLEVLEYTKPPVIAKRGRPRKVA